MKKLIFCLILALTAVIITPSQPWIAIAVDAILIQLKLDRYRPRCRLGPVLDRPSRHGDYRGASCRGCNYSSG